LWVIEYARADGLIKKVGQSEIMAPQRESLVKGESFIFSYYITPDQKHIPLFLTIFECKPYLYGRIRLNIGRVGSQSFEFGLISDFAVS
jgi:hypothetical protein